MVRQNKRLSMETGIMLLGVVNEYDYKTRTASIVTVDQHPVTIPDIPVWSIFTGSTIFNIPLEKGTVGLIMFVDVDTTDFFHNGNISVKFVDAFRTELNNAIFIPGWNSFVQEYDVEEKGVLLKRGNCNIVIKDDNLKLSSKSSYLDIKEKEIVLDIDSKLTVSFKDGTLSITNNTGEMVQLLSDTMQHLSNAINALLSATVATALGPSTLDPATILTLTTLKTQLDTITKTKFDTFI
jgi:hypothetical protein